MFAMETLMEVIGSSILQMNSRYILLVNILFIKFNLICKNGKPSIPLIPSCLNTTAEGFNLLLYKLISNKVLKQTNALYNFDYLIICNVISNIDYLVNIHLKKEVLSGIKKKKKLVLKIILIIL